MESIQQQIDELCAMILLNQTQLPTKVICDRAALDAMEIPAEFVTEIEPGVYLVDSAL